MTRKGTSFANKAEQFTIESPYRAPLISCIRGNPTAKMLDHANAPNNNNNNNNNNHG